MRLKFKRTSLHTLPLPKRETAQAAGYDLRTLSEIWLSPGLSTVVHTGFAVEIPDGYEGTVRPRGSTSFRGVHVCFGTVDADYRGEIVVNIRNQSQTVQVYEPGDRIAQLVISKVELLEVEEVDELTPTERGSGKFGSTGST